MSIPKELTQQVFEYRGVDDLYVAKVLQDTAEAYVCSEPIRLAPVAEVGKTVDSPSEAHYYDNKPMIVIRGEGDDQIQIIVAPPELQRLAYVTGKSFDEDTGMMVDGEASNDYYALMYRCKGNDGKYRYVARNKGTFSIPAETYATENNGTDANNVTFTYTGIYTTHEFNKGKFDETTNTWVQGSAKGVVVDTRYGLADVSGFFNAVQTPDTIQASGTIAATGVALAPSVLSMTAGDTSQLVPVVLPTNATNKAVTYSTSDDTVATVSEAGLVTALAAGTATITVTTEDGGFTDTCSVTVAEAEA